MWNKGNASLPKGRVVCGGYEIKKLPLGRYLTALEKVQSLPSTLLSACFPGKKLDEILSSLKHIDEEMLIGLVANLLGTCAPYLMTLVSELSGIEEEKLREDPAIGAAGLVEILQAVWEVNELKNVTAALRQTVGKWKAGPGTAPRTTGSQAS